MSFFGLEARSMCGKVVYLHSCKGGRNVWETRLTLYTQQQQLVELSSGKQKKKKKFIWLNVKTINMTIYNIKQSQIARKPWGQPSWPPKHIQFLDYHKTKTTIVNTITITSLQTRPWQCAWPPFPLIRWSRHKMPAKCRSYNVKCCCPDYRISHTATQGC